ncbi:thiazole tautomerase TenI [Gracilibacillus oryzae]|uniref:Thiazole tautomerase TenI n=1 Tax=Gracilibacillus oryzae TaxID=1672701 RepID=A0A7C8KSF4_9BACI|nr:thiamine phosphate synthase [Gracilibacillus oryzae]KAB8139020.1 thiazole tautomerase TenI [Gracilibacillus oryzae]
MKGIHLITNGKITKADLEQLGSFHHYFDYIHVREKTKSAAELLEVLDIIWETGIPLSKIIVNDRVDLAVMRDCAGVQLAYHSPPVNLVRERFPDIKIGKSVHSAAEARKAEADGADFVLYGHIYHSNSKQGVNPRGLKNLQDVAQTTSIPVIGVGGIKPDQVKEVLDTGANGVAMISSVWEAAEPIQVAKAYYDRFNHWKEEQHEKTV